jgi:hypothetical protein
VGSRRELAWWDRFVTASLSYEVDLVSTESVWGCWHNSPAIDRSQEICRSPHSPRKIHQAGLAPPDRDVAAQLRRVVLKLLFCQRGLVWLRSL